MVTFQLLEQFQAVSVTLYSAFRFEPNGQVSITFATSPLFDSQCDLVADGGRRIARALFETCHGRLLCFPPEHFVSWLFRQTFDACFHRFSIAWNFVRSIVASSNDDLSIGLHEAFNCG